jgi:D-glycero-D-manno-heptose 1,7-bisphosphate phosphatase
MKSENKAVFLDRDGVLIKDVNYLSSLDQIRMFDDVPAGLKILKEHGFKLIMITNQSGVSRGLFDESFVRKTYDYLNSMLIEYGTSLDALYYCPHHPDGKPPYNIVCNCRKPAAGMIQNASKDHRIDCSQSYMIGDKKCDVELSINAGTSGILLKTGKDDLEVERVESQFPDTPILETFSDAIDFILKTEKEK